MPFVWDSAIRDDQPQLIPQQQAKEDQVNDVALYLPGEVYWMEEIEEKTGDGKNRPKFNYRLYRVEDPMKFFGQIVLSPMNIAHHLADNVETAMAVVCREGKRRVMKPLP